MIMKKVLGYFRNRYLCLVSPYYLISFPKSGRTWIKSFLANYYSYHYKIPLFTDFAPMWRYGKRKNVPRVIMTHAAHRGCTEDEMFQYMDSIRDKKIILVIRSPDKVAFSYYHRLVKRIHDPEVENMELSDFIRSKSLGLPQIVSFINAWYRYKGNFNNFMLLRYEDCVDDPESQFIRLLDFLSCPIDKQDLKVALTRSVDTTRKIEEEGDLRDQSLLHEISLGSQYFESSMDDTGNTKRYSGDDGAFENSFSQGDLSYMNAEVSKLDSKLGY